MKKKTKTTFNVYAAWDFDKEAEEYNRMSEKGWQLVNGGCFCQKYEFDDSVVYRYQLDFNNKIDSMERYDEMFREMGWERINSTFNNWHIFRKKYDPSLPEEEYEIYTDNESRIEMLKRWRNLSLVVTLFLLSSAIHPINQAFNGYYTLAGSIALIGLYLTMFIMLISGFFGINNLIKGKKNNHRFNFNLFLMLIILELVILGAAEFIGSANIYFPLGMLCGFGLVAVVIGIKSLINKR